MSKPHGTERNRPWVARMGWLLLFWAGGVAALALVAYLLRLFMNWAGFSS